MDRFGLSVQHLVDPTNRFRDEGAGFRSLTENMDTAMPAGVPIFHVFAAMAQFERDLIHESTIAGLIVAKALGRKGGRTSELGAKQGRWIRELYDTRVLTVDEIGRQFGVSRSMVLQGVGSHRSQEKLGLAVCLLARGATSMQGATLHPASWISSTMRPSAARICKRIRAAENNSDSDALQADMNQ